MQERGEVGPFRLEREVGRGGMGVVYRALDVRSGTPVALKLLSSEGADGASRKRFEREADTLATLEHPGIVRYVGHGHTETGAPYIAMDWLDGEDLAGRLRRGPLAVAHAVDLCRTLADALAAVHAKGIVHRDLKPSNVMLAGGNERRPVVLDFGIARNLANATMTATGHALGTPQYMAPEQIRGVNGVDARADLFALGAILYECVAGRPPFDGEHVMAVLAKVLLEDTPSLAASGRPLPPSLTALCSSLLSKNAGERPANASVVRARLDDCARELEGAGDGDTILVQTRTPANALTGRERRLAAVVLAEERPAATAFLATATPEDSVQARARLEEAVNSHGGELSLLGPQRFLVAFPGGGEAIDRASSAARCALSVASAWPAATVALALGRGLVAGAAVGEVIDRAAVLLGAPGEARVRADDATGALLELRFQVLQRDGFQEIVSEREPEERPRTLLGKPTRFVGRDREIGVLEATLAEVVEDGVARCLLVTGPSGVGKSRLRHELVERIRHTDGQHCVLVARAEALRAGSPLDLCAGLVRAWASIQGGSDEAARAALTGQVERRLAGRADRADVAAFLGEIVGAAFPAEASSRLALARQDPRLLGEHMLRAFVSFLRAECAENPVVLILEDLHWGDPQTVRFLDSALRELANDPLFVLALARPDVHERFPGLWKSRGVSEVALLGLSPRVCERLARSVLGEVDPALLERIVRHSDGNAFYLEELIRAAADGGLSALPASVVAMVQVRLEAQDAESRRVLRAASVLGETFPVAAVAALIGDASLDVAAVAERLVDAEVMVRRGDAPVGTLSFRHAAVREAAYAMLTDQDRRIGHGLAARWLEASGEHDAQLLAEHFDRAGDAANAARCFARAAEQALERSDFDAALNLGARAVDLGAQGVVLGEALLARGRALHCLGRLVEACSALEAALDALPEPEGERRLQAMRELWNTGVFRQSSSIIRRAGAEATRLARELGRGDIAAEAECALALADHCDGRCDEALGRYRRALSAAGDRPSFLFGVSSLLLYHLGEYAEGEQVSKRLLATARDMRDHATVATLLGNLGILCAGMGRYEEAREYFAEARAVGERYGLPMLTARAMSLSAGHFLDVLDIDGAALRATETVRVGRELEFPTPRVSATLDLALAAARRGALDEASRTADGVSAEVQAGSGFHGWLWRSRMAVLRAELAAERGAFGEALALGDAAAEMCARLSRTKYVVAAEVIRARARWGLGQRDAALAGLNQILETTAAFPDPAVRLRVATALLGQAPHEHARDVATRAAADMERGLPAADRPRFRRAADLLLATPR